MNFKKFCKNYASEIGGEFREYDASQSVIIVPLEDGRFQTVTGHISMHPEYSREVIQLKTKVCSIAERIPYEEILAVSPEYPYTKCIIEEGFLKVEAICFMINLTENMIKEMIQEVANHADQWEFIITGKDIH